MLLLGLSPQLPATAVTVVGLIAVMAVLAGRFVVRLYATDRIACIFVAFVALLWILWHAVTRGSDPTWAVAGTVAGRARP